MFVEAGEYLAPIGLTEYTLEKQTGQHSLTMEQFGGDVGAFWSAWTSCKTPEARERAEMAAYMELLRKPGRVEDGAKAVKAADALGVKIPLRTRGFMLEKLAAFIVDDDGYVESISYYRNGGRAYTGSGVYQVLTAICKAAREYAQRCECGQVSC